MGRERWFVVVLVVMSMGLATVAAVSGSPDNAEKKAFEGFGSLDEATVTENWERYFPAQYDGWARTAEAEEMDIEKSY